MLNKTSLLLASALVAIGAGAANADPYDQGRHDNDRNGSNPYAASDQDHTYYGNGYNYGYDDGYAHRERNDHYRSDAYRSASDRSYARGAYYYGNDCNGNTATGTIVGAVAGGVIGNQFGHGDGRTAATVGGVILGGLAGNAIARNMDCNDRRYALVSYRDGFEGRIGHHYRWHNNNNSSYGSFTPVREYSRNGDTCRDFRDTSYRSGHRYNHSGTACRHNDGNWYLD